MHVLIVSDFHLGKGRFLRNGQVNILEDFEEDERFCEFLKYYSTGEWQQRPVHLVLNGDILNLLQIDCDGVFTHLQTEEMIVGMVSDIIDGHAEFFEALGEFARSPKKKITYVIGNHDFGVVSPKAQEFIEQAIGATIEFCMECQIGQLHIEHGQRFEQINSVPEGEYFIEGPNHRKILNLPWGSLFCLYLMPKLKKDRPYIDKVRPLSVYIKWSFLHDFGFFIHLAFVLFRYFRATRSRAFTRYNRNFVTRWRLLSHFSVHPKYDRNAKRIFASRKDLKAIVMGHTHIAEWRRFPGGKLYFNSGTWNSVPSMDAGQHKSISHLTYVEVKIVEESGAIAQANLNSWQGQWRPYREEVAVNPDFPMLTGRKKRRRLVPGKILK